MAALQCPDCGHREMLDALGDVDTFSCGGCGRALKVPAQFRTVAAPAAAASAVPPHATAASPRVAASAASTAPPEPAPDPAPAIDWREQYPLDTAASRAAASKEREPLAWWLRGLIWLFALPFSLVVTFAAFHSFGWLSRNDLVNTLTEVGWDRFVPVARVLPVAALLTALIVQVSVIVLESARNQRRRTRAGTAQRERATAS
jgi:hypothetical protein